MRAIASSLLIFAGLVKSAVGADSAQQKYPQSVKISYELIGDGKQQPLAEVLYNPSTLATQLASWTPPSTDGLKSTSSEESSAPLVRISLPDGTSTVTTLNSFDPSISQYIDLWLSSKGTDSTIISANISPISPPPLSEEEIRQKRKEERARAKGKPVPVSKPKPKPKSKSKTTTKKDGKVEAEKPDIPGGPVVQVTMRRAGSGPQPKLMSRPAPVVDSEGREVQQQDPQEKSFFQKYWWIFMVATVLLMSGGGGGEEKK